MEDEACQCRWSLGENTDPIMSGSDGEDGSASEGAGDGQGDGGGEGASLATAIDNR